MDTLKIEEKKVKANAAPKCKGDDSIKHNKDSHDNQDEISPSTNEHHSNSDKGIEMDGIISVAARVHLVECYRALGHSTYKHKSEKKAGVSK